MPKRRPLDVTVDIPTPVRARRPVRAEDSRGSTRPDLADDSGRGFRSSDASVEVLALEIAGAKTKGILVYPDQRVQRGCLAEAAGGFTVYAALRVGERPPVLLGQLLRSFRGQLYFHLLIP